jgi:hypothetical protein
MSKDYLYITGYILKAENILNYPGVITFRGEDSRGSFIYDSKLNALDGYKSILYKRETGDVYDYTVDATNAIRVRSDWIDSLDYDVDWTLVPIDETIEVSTGNGKWYPMHFAGYEPDNPNENYYFTFRAGRSSETSLDLKEKISIVAKDWEDLSSKYLLLYSIEKSFYLWFNLEEDSTDPKSSGGPLDGTDYEPIEINIETGEPADSIANKIKNKVDALEDFDASVSNSEVTIEVVEVGKVYDASSGTSGLTVTTKVQGGDVEGWPLARPILP